MSIKDKKIKIPVYYVLDEKEKVVIDEESMRREFEKRLEAIIKKYEGGEEK